MLVIYHSRDYLPARQAAAIHTGLLPPGPPADLREARSILEAGRALTATGLWAAGTDSDGRRIFAVGRASRPEVAYRAFCAMANLMGVDRSRFLLQNVGSPVAWAELAVSALGRLGLVRLAERLELGILRRTWAQAGCAVSEANQRLQRRP